MKTPRADFTLEFKNEAVRLVHSGQRQSQVSASLGSDFTKCFDVTDG